MESTQSRILDAASAEFATYGLSGARVNRIAHRARANKERLYHYFGDKQALFAAAIESARRRIVAAQPFVADDLGAYVQGMFGFHDRHPELIQLLLADDHRRRSLGDFATDARWREHYAARVGAVREAQARGLVRRDVDPRAVVYAVLALVTTAHALPGLTQAILEADSPDGGLSKADLAAELGSLLAGLGQPG